jgi:formylglycine-generating enzyme required for sulfatase activity
MRILFILCLSLTYCISASAQIVSKHKFFKTLPNFVPLEGEYLFIDETEISNNNWKEYLVWLRQTGDTATYHVMYPDTLVWRSSLGYNEPYVHYYFDHPAYQDYPVVGVTHAQAQAYSAWRADRIMDVLRLKGSDIAAIEVRLPSEGEWKKAARGTLPDCAKFPWEDDGMRKNTGKERDRGLILGNMRRGAGGQGGIANILNDGALITAPVASYWPNTIGLYNMAGNVSEWVEEKKAMGSSWNDFAQQARLDYSPAQLADTTTLATLGFRCVLEIVSFKKDVQTKPLELKAKMIDKHMRYMPFDSIQNNYTDNQYLLASDVETSNLMFNTFLAETGKSEFKSDTKNWYQYTRYHHMQMYDWHPFYDKHPVVNISYEAAVAYCAWLTNKYNTLEKRKYKKVEFRLPSRIEWEYAAAGGRVNNRYPWGGPYERNSKGSYLANFCPLEEQYISGYSQENFIQGGFQYNYPNGDYTISRKADRVEYLCAGNLYFPNDYGIYQVAGNAAEMLAQKSISKGGSWNSNQYEIEINAEGGYDRPSPKLGFRVFMKVVEQ